MGERLVSDLFYALPASRLADLRSALDASGNTPQQWAGSAHYTWRILDERIGGSLLHFIDSGGQCAVASPARLREPMPQSTRV